jgi:hypothetical protein
VGSTQGRGGWRRRPSRQSRIPTTLNCEGRGYFPRPFFLPLGGGGTFNASSSTSSHGPSKANRSSFGPRFFGSFFGLSLAAAGLRMESAPCGQSRARTASGYAIGNQLVGERGRTSSVSFHPPHWRMPKRHLLVLIAVSLTALASPVYSQWPIPAPWKGIHQPEKESGQKQDKSTSDQGPGSKAIPTLEQPTAASCQPQSTQQANNQERQASPEGSLFWPSVALDIITGALAIVAGACGSLRGV